MTSKALCLALGSLAIGLAPLATAETSFNLSTVSLYKSRGVDQDGRNQAVRPALQGGVDQDFSSGFYLGNWNSTGRFGDANVEVDLYGGYRAELARGLGLDLGYIHYVYPGEGAWNQGEAYVGVDYRGMAFKVYRGLRKDVNRGDLYYEFGYAHPLVARLDLRLGLGYQRYQVEDLRDKLDFSVGLDYTLMKSLTLSGAIVGASRRDEPDDGSHKTRVIVGLSATF